MKASIQAGLEQAFQLAASELGFCSAAWLFVKAAQENGGEESLLGLRDALGRAFPVLDAVIDAYQKGMLAPDPNPGAVVDLCWNAEKVLVVGLEAEFLDALMSALSKPEVYLLTHSDFDVDWTRVLSNYGGKVLPVSLNEFQRCAGPKSVLLTYVYGVHGHSTHVLPAWMRVTGEDVRTQFRSLIGWDVLRSSFFVYPRWLVEISAQSFTHLLSS